MICRCQKRCGDRVFEECQMQDRLSSEFHLWFAFCSMITIYSTLLLCVTQRKVASCPFLWCGSAPLKASFKQGVSVPYWDIAMLHVTEEGHLDHSSANLKLNHLKVQVPPRCFFGCLKHPSGLHKCWCDLLPKAYSTYFSI